MKIRLTFVIALFFTLAALYAEASVKVQWDKPEDFRDFQTSLNDGERDLAALMQEFERFAGLAVKGALPEGTNVAVTMKQIDMAGGFEWWRGPDVEDVRIVDSSRPARIEFAYVLTDASGKELASGEFKRRHNHLTQPGLRDRDEHFPYVRDLFREWLRDVKKELSAAK